MPYAGQQLQPRDCASLVNLHWPQNKTKALATLLAESQGYIEAYHLNFDTDGVTLLSEDCGIMQVNVRAADVGGARATQLLTDPVYNVGEARKLYDAPWIRDGVTDKRRFEPWVSYTSGWATFPEFWVWHQEAGVPVGPWVPTGRYIQKAIAGVANWHSLIEQDMTPEEALVFAQGRADVFGVKVKPTFAYKNGLPIVTFIAPKRPTNPPADGIGPRPVENSGI